MSATTTDRAAFSHKPFRGLLWKLRGERLDWVCSGCQRAVLLKLEFLEAHAGGHRFKSCRAHQKASETCRGLTIYSATLRARSSAGERVVHTDEATGSIPVAPTSHGVLQAWDIRRPKDADSVPNPTSTHRDLQNRYERDPRPVTGASGSQEPGVYSNPPWLPADPPLEPGQ